MQLHIDTVRRILESSRGCKKYLDKEMFDKDCKKLPNPVCGIKYFSVFSDKNVIHYSGDPDSGDPGGFWDISGDELKYHYDLLGAMGCFLHYSPEHSQGSHIPVQYLSWAGHDRLNELKKQANNPY